MNANQRGQILPIVMITLVVMTLSVYALVSWVQNDARIQMKAQRTTTSVNFAEAALDRGTWKLQSTTTTWNTAAAGGVVAGYNFDITYNDIPGGTYRVKFSSGPSTSQVTIIAEGRDNSSKEVRAVSAVFKNQAIYSPLMAGGNISWAKGLGVFWGPIMSQGNLTLQDNFVAAWYFPRKFAKGVVIGTALYPRDTNGLLPPNTDNVEWWTQYAGVPNVPVLDFSALRSSAAATGTLNVYGCKNSTIHGANVSTAGAAPWDLRGSCVVTAGDATPHNKHFGNSTNYVKTYLDPTKDYVWYWDNDVTLTGAFCGSSPCSPGQSTGLRGTLVVRGTLTIDTQGDLIYSGHVPATAWQDETKLTVNTFDTSASGEYPGDIGFHTSTGTFGFGTDTWTQPLSGGGWRTTVGVRGFTYVGGDLNILQYLDFNGAVWVNGNVLASSANTNNFCGIFYDDTLSVPALNVILLRQSWQEIAPSNAIWY
jgi:Tfp pilus assembly protein PilX